MRDGADGPRIGAKTARRCCIADAPGSEQSLDRRKRHAVALVQHAQQPRHKLRVTA